MTDLSKIIEEFGYGFLQDVFQFYQRLSKAGITAAQFVEWMDADRSVRLQLEIKNIEEGQVWIDKFIAKAPKCEVCGRPMVLEIVNNMPKRMIDDHSKTWWICPDGYCEGEPITSDKTVAQVLADMKMTFPPEVTDERVTRRRRLALEAKKGKFGFKI